ncbi:Hypothetical predicted protein [Cloeon dipterum]|uniref:Uncharacterized protein n=1 Tax=Cloeon dipterum TaxID=197152 RepID=A0A8S1DTV2_9INSE|nr:Hypothetical predicted protein [Cloeon dipterum]
MDDVTKLLVAQRRLLNLSRNKSLLELSTQKIVKNVKWFLEDNHQEKLTKLPSLLRKKLLDKVTGQRFIDINEELKDLNSRIEALELLLCPQIKEIKLQGLMAVDPDTFDKVLEIITTRAPNLIALTIIAPSRRNYKRFPKTHEFPVSMMEIGKLGKLRKLVLKSSTVEYNQMKEMCRNELKNLRYLDVCLNFDSDTNFEDVEDFKESFSNLQYFLFDSFSRDVGVCPKIHGKMLWKMCFKHLPNLIAVEKFVQDKLQLDLEERGISEIPLEVSSLRHLSVIPGTVELQNAFPNITHLKIWFDDDESDMQIEPLLKFKNIKCLILEDVMSLETVNKFIRRYGHKLEKLFLTATETNDIRLKFKSLFNSCPRLETLALTNVDMVDDREPLHFFSKLKNLYWSPSSCGKSICLSNIIRAPDLRMLKFKYNSFDVDDLAKVSDLIAEKTILRKLISLSAIDFDIVELKNPMEDQSFVVSFNAFSEMIKNASAFLPCFIDIALRTEFIIKDFNLIMQPHDYDYRFIDRHFAAALRILDANIVDFLIAIKRNLFAN